MSGSGQVAGRGADRVHERDAADGSSGAPPGPGGAGQVPARGLLDGVDGLLDEIDAVLEDNAEEFVRGYVQKGGQ